MLCHGISQAQVHSSKQVSDTVQVTQERLGELSEQLSHAQSSSTTFSDQILPQLQLSAQNLQFLFQRIDAAHDFVRDVHQKVQQLEQLVIQAEKMEAQYAKYEQKQFEANAPKSAVLLNKINTVFSGWGFRTGGKSAAPREATVIVRSSTNIVPLPKIDVPHVDPSVYRIHVTSLTERMKRIEERRQRVLNGERIEDEDEDESSDADNENGEEEKETEQETEADNNKMQGTGGGGAVILDHESDIDDDTNDIMNSLMSSPSNNRIVTSGGEIMETVVETTVETEETTVRDGAIDDQQVGGNGYRTVEQADIVGEELEGEEAEGEEDEDD